MIVYLVAEASRILAGDPSEATNHIEQIATVVQFLATEDDTSTLSPDLQIINRDNPSKNTIADFRAYASECPIEEISAVPRASRPLPISVRWDCMRIIELDGRAFNEERGAGFSLSEGLIKRVVFGKLVVVSTDEVAAKIRQKLGDVD